MVNAGASTPAQALMGKTVALFGGAMYTQFRAIKAAQCLVLPDGTTPAEGASCFVNPLTVLGMVGTMRLEGHSAGAYRGGVQPGADVEQCLHAGEHWPGEYRPQTGAYRPPQGPWGTPCMQL